MTSVSLHATVPALGAAAGRLLDHLARCGYEPAGGAAADVVLVVSDRPCDPAQEQQLLARVAEGSSLLLLGPTARAWRDSALLERAGVLVGREGPAHETRLRPGPDGEVGARSGGEVLLRDCWPGVDKVADDTEVLLTANLALVEHPVAFHRAGVAGLTLGSAPEVLDDPAYRRLVHRLVRHVLGVRDGAPARVGILGYGAIGHEHSAAIQAVPGLELAAVCDTNPERLAAARALAADLTVHRDGVDLLADADVDLVVVSTWPSTHAQWALAALRAGKHVVVEKPFCLTTDEADEMVRAAADAGRTLAVYQNRRWDADYLALKRLVRSGALGEVFHYESFIGSYGHPCNYWHSDAGVSGGAIYDWGSHYLDWLLDLSPAEVVWVSATTQKRVWHDVSNADHSVVRMRFVDGMDAEFTHSDIAAAMKPKWYVLGTGGAVVGHWRAERVVSRSAIGTLDEDPLAASDSPARLELHHPDGSVTAVAVPPAPAQPFHRELADALLSGAPMSVTPQGARRNIAVMEAATESARLGGQPVVPR